MKSYNEILSDVTKTATKIPQSDYLDTGKYRIFDQGKEYSVGFSNDEQGVVSDYPYIIFGDHTRVVKYVNEPCFIGADGVKLLKVINKDFNPRFVYYNILAKPIENQGYARHFKFLKEIQFTEKTLSVQTNIVTELDTIQSAIDNKKQQLSLLDEAVKSRFIEMFGDKPVESGKWKVEKLEDVCDLITDGTHKTPNYQQKGIRFISAKNIINGKIDLTDTKFITEEEYKQIQKRCRVEKNDVLLTKSGSLGSSAIIDFDIPIGLFESLAVIKYKRNLLNGIFVKELLSAESSQKQFNNGVKGIAIKHLHLNVIAALKIPIPPIELQNDFASFVQQIDKSKFVVKQQIADLQELLDYKMNKYFGD